MSSGEAEFYHVLRHAVEGHYLIFAKVGLGDLFYADADDRQASWLARGRFSQKHVDFLLCDPVSIRPVLGIELDDSSHNQPDQQRRDSVKNEVFKDAGLPLLRIPMRAGFSAAELAAQIYKKLSEVPSCPVHGLAMQRYVARRGGFAGHAFYGCPKYPECRERIPIDR